MGGLIQTGTSYKNTAISGLIRESAEQQKIDEANAEIEAQGKMRDVTMAGELASIGILFAMLM